jgi:hypothetical protein
MPKRKKTGCLIAGGAFLLLIIISAALSGGGDDDPTRTISLPDETATAAMAPTSRKAVATAAPTDTPAGTSVPTRTPKPTRTLVPTVAPTSTPDASVEAKEVQAQVMSIFEPAEEAAAALKTHAALIAEGESTDVVRLYLLAKEARDAWDTAGTALLMLSVEDERLDEAVTSLWMCTVSRAEALTAFMEYIDDQKPSDLATYQEKTSESEGYLLYGLAQIISLTGVAE